MCVGVGGVDHDRNDGRGGLKGAEGKDITLCLEELSHCIKIIDVQSHAEEAQILNLVVTHQIHVVSVSVYQNVIFHKLGIVMMSHLQIKALGQDLNTQLGVFAANTG